MLRKYALLIVFACLVMGLVFPQPLSAKSVRQLRRQGNEISRKMSALEMRIHQLKKTQKTARERLHEAELNLKTSCANLREVRAQLQATRQKLVKTKAELVAIEKRLKKQNDLMASRLASDYRRGNAGYLNVLLGSADFSDLMNRSYQVRSIVEVDVDAMNKFKVDREDARQHKITLEQQEKKRVQLEEEQKGLVHEIADETEVRTHTLQEVSQERIKEERQLDELERANRQIEAMIRSMERTPRGIKLLGKAWHGSFMRPVNGRITCSFGMRNHPISGRRELHTGVDIGCPVGTPVHAAAGGLVTVARWNTAYGFMVIIDHGGGVTTLYGHNSHLVASVGQAVKQGQVIAYSGSTGWSTGPHCHFQVNKHGTPVNPL